METLCFTVIWSNLIPPEASEEEEKVKINYVKNVLYLSTLYFVTIEKLTPTQ
jgi:hypothetical protein